MTGMTRGDANLDPLGGSARAFALGFSDYLTKRTGFRGPRASCRVISVHSSFGAPRLPSDHGPD